MTDSGTSAKNTTADSTSDAADTASKTVSPRTKLLLKVALVVLALDLLYAAIATAVQLSMVDALAGLAGYSGFGYGVAMIGTALLSFLGNMFFAVVANIVLLGGAFVITVAFVTIFGGRRRPAATVTNTAADIGTDAASGKG